MAGCLTELTLHHSSIFRVPRPEYPPHAPQISPQSFVIMGAFCWRPTRLG